MNKLELPQRPPINIANIGVTENNARLYDKEFNHRLAKSPKFSANLIAKYNFITGAFKGSFVGAGIRHTGEYLLSDNFDYDLYVQTETKFDAFAGYTTRFWNIPTTIQINLQNIGGKVNDFTRDDGFVVRGRLSLQF